MKIILLERITKLGQMGDEVTVKDGYARNFLLPKGKALRSTKANAARFEVERAQLEARNLERKSEAEAIAVKLDGNAFVAIRSAGETGQLYGSVAARDIAATLEENGFTVGRNQIELTAPIKTIGMHDVRIILHPEVDAGISINVARSDEEAARQASGEDLTQRDAFDDDDDDIVAQDDAFENEEDGPQAEEGDDEATADEAASDEAEGEATADETSEEEATS